MYLSKLDAALQTYAEMPSASKLDAIVPCGKCCLCCQGNSLVMILPERGDDSSLYDVTTLSEMLGTVGETDETQVLKIKPNGDCVHLGPTGCEVHDLAPFICRTYDCREQFRMYTKVEREVLVHKKYLNAEILRRGAILIHQALKHGPQKAPNNFLELPR